MTPWRALCMQVPAVNIDPGDDDTAAAAVIETNLSAALAAVDTAMGADGEVRPRLLLFPEWAFTGPPHGESYAEWIPKACRTVPGPISDALAAAAVRHGVYIAANQWEIDEDWPGRYFNTSFLLSPTGELLLRYRRIHTNNWCSPHDVLDDYVERYGLDGVYPVADTELGRLAILPCGEIAVPEAVRMLALRGAEVLLHPTNEVRGLDQELAKQARAVENMMYVISTNVAGRTGYGPPGEPQGGRSRIVDFTGATLAYEDAPVTTTVSAQIDIDALRAARRDTGGANRLIALRPEMYRDTYAAAAAYPANAFLAGPVASLDEVAIVRDSALATLIGAGVVADD